MAAFNFPNSPSTNDIHSENGVSFKWNGSMWNRFGPAYTDTVNLNVTGIGTIAGNFHVGGVLTYEDVKNVDSVGIVTARAGVKVTGGNVELIDDRKLRLGTGNDLNIYHENSSTTNWIEGAGLIRLQTSSGNIEICPKNGAEKGARFVTDGAAELYHNGTLKFSTTSSGARAHDQLQVDGTIFAAVGLKVNVDSQKIRLGASDDLELYHDGADSWITHNNGGNGSLVIKSTTTAGSPYGLYIDSDFTGLRNEAQNEYYLKATNGGAVELYHNNVKKFETTSSAIKITGTGPTLIEGTSNANLLSLRNTTGGNGTVGILFSTNATAGREKAAIYHKETHGTAHYKGDFIFCLNSASGGAGQVSASDERMRINSTGGVGIGTDNFAGELDNRPGLAIHSNHNDSCRLLITTPTKSPTRLGYFGLNRFGVDVQNGFEIRDVAASYATRFLIDSSGYIHRDSMPVFHAQSSPSRDGSGFIHSFGSVHTNIGNHYNNGNGKFTAPVNGFYFFGFTVWCNDSNANDSTGTLAVVTIRNSSDTYQRDAAAFNVMPGDGASYSLSAAGSGVVYMDANHYARLNTQFSLRGSQPRNMFSGFLLHAT